MEGPGRLGGAPGGTELARAEGRRRRHATGLAMFLERLDRRVAVPVEAGAGQALANELRRGGFIDREDEPSANRAGGVGWNRETSDPLDRKNAKRRAACDLASWTFASRSVGFVIRTRYSKTQPCGPHFSCVARALSTVPGNGADRTSACITPVEHPERRTRRVPAIRPRMHRVSRCAARRARGMPCCHKVGGVT